MFRIEEFRHKGL